MRDSRVALSRVGSSYRIDDSGFDLILSSLTATLGWANAKGAFGTLVRPGDKVLIKPNWVLHRNQGRTQGEPGFESLVTHASLLRALIRALQASAAERITIGDAPVQGCDFDDLLNASKLTDWMIGVKRRDARVIGPVDFRRTVSSITGQVRTSHENVRSIDEYVLFDLGATSYLEPVTQGQGRFRVTMYPPSLMARTHAPGRHQYLVAREVIEANLIVNAPKLKTHKKAGVTCALKNLVGINGNKEYLPHHRVGHPAIGGDCYPEESSVKRVLERVYDAQNSSRRPHAQRAFGTLGRVLQGIAHRLGDQVGVEGAWSGNDTVWRMCLDLNRILHYGCLDGTIASVPQRQVINIVDAIVAGQGDGPLAPEPLAMGLLIAGASSAAIDWIGSHLLGFDPAAIPITVRSFDPTPWPIVRFAPSDIEVIENKASVKLEDLSLPVPPREITYPAGWLSAVRLSRSESGVGTERDA